MKAEVNTVQVATHPSGGSQSMRKSVDGIVPRKGQCTFCGGERSGSSGRLALCLGLQLASLEDRKQSRRSKLDS